MITLRNEERTRISVGGKASVFKCYSFLKQSRVPVLHTGILATQETEIRRIIIRSWSGQIVLETPISKNSLQKRAGRVA
jgi:hypothetical protein